MAAAAEPSGHLIACAVHPGQRADDPLYTPLIAQVRQTLGRSGLLYTGDCKMAALATRAEIVAHEDYYLVPLPLTGDTAREFETWVEAVVEGPQAARLIWDQDRLLGAGYEFERSLTASVDNQSLTWTERVQVVRSLALAQQQSAQLEKRLTAAETALRGLTPAPGRGKRQIRTEEALQAAIASVLEQHGVVGLLSVTWQRHETTQQRYIGSGRSGPNRPTHTVSQVRYVITDVQRNESACAARRDRLGWRVQVTQAPVDMLSLSEAVIHYRGGWSLERDFHLVKDLPLGLSPLFVWQNDQIKGLVRLLTLALRLLTLVETQVRQGLARDGTTMAGLYPGQPNRTTDRPTAERVLNAFAKAKITLTEIRALTGSVWHITPLSPLHEQVLRYLHLQVSLYTNLTMNSS
jgi:transposase